MIFVLRFEKLVHIVYVIPEYTALDLFGRKSHRNDATSDVFSVEVKENETIRIRCASGRLF